MNTTSHTHAGHLAVTASLPFPAALASVPALPPRPETSGLSNEEIRRIVWFEPANAVKVVMPRRIVSGAPGDADVYGAQQHAPLLGLNFDL